MSDSPRLEELRRRVQADPASIAFAALAEEYRRANRYEEAIETCRTGLQRHPAYLSARVTLGRALIEMRDYDAARVELEAVLATAPENLAAIRGLAEIHHRRGELPEALEQYKSALQFARHDPELERAVDSIEKSVGAPPVEQASAAAASGTPDWAIAAAAPVAPPPAPIKLARMSAPDAVPDGDTMARLERLLAAVQRARAEMAGALSL
ncbi:MAG TPA: tetratricopeptide repeat protein [Vicinamibacterales bacterium]|nr:tetratricopeptide repeat protein [Vicinamibacterales bacterium]